MPLRSLLSVIYEAEEMARFPGETNQNDFILGLYRALDNCHSYFFALNDAHMVHLLTPDANMAASQRAWTYLEDSLPDNSQTLVSV